MIDINGLWSSKNGVNKILIIQSGDRFEGYVGDEANISLGTISQRALNFKQTWHSGENEGAVATVYGRLTNDNGHILLEFEGMRANGKVMKGKNAICRGNIMGSWIPMSGTRGDTWVFNLVNDIEINGRYDSRHFKDPIKMTGHRNQENRNFFIVYLELYGGRSERIQGEFRSPNIILSLSPGLGNQTLTLVRKPPEAMPDYEEYEPYYSLSLESKSEIHDPVYNASLSSMKRPCRYESTVTNDQVSQSHYNKEDLRRELLSSSPRQITDIRKHHICCSCSDSRPCSIL